MFNLPRVAIWPIYNASRGEPKYDSHLSPFDRLIHYCASVGKFSENELYEYIFKREQADSTTFDYENIPRNKDLFEYLSKMTSEKIPGYNASFQEKYGAEREQILTLIFDYIRSTNLHDDTLYSDFEEAFADVNTENHPTYTNPRDNSEPGFGHKGHGQVTPITIKGNKGMGRFFTISGAQIHVGGCATTSTSYHDRYPGVWGYPGRTQYDPPDGTAYTNLPPLPAGVTMQSTVGQPTWLRNLEMTDNDQYRAAFDPANWNWQLAFLSDRYRDAVLKNPTANKFNQSLITDSQPLRLQGDERLVQAVFHFNLFSPSIGWCGINPGHGGSCEKNVGNDFHKC